MHQKKCKAYLKQNMIYLGQQNTNIVSKMAKSSLCQKICLIELIYQKKQMDNNIKLILMSCCAPCSCGAIKQVLDGEIPGIDDFIVMFFNPNIFPETEYQKRLNEQIKYCEKLGVKYVVGDYNHDDWKNAVHGLENEPERGLRCSKCFAYRFCYAREYAEKHGFNAISSVFGVSKHKNQVQVDCAANASCGTIKYLPIKWDDNLRNKINHESEFYRQNYCGCEYSIRK